MMLSKRWMMLVVVMLVAGGCASSGETKDEEPERVFVEAEPVEKPEPPPPEIVRVPVVQAAPGQARPAPPVEEPTEEEIEEMLEQARERPFEIIDKANEKARAAPLEDGYFNAVQVYDYAPGLLYQVYAAEGRLTSIQFAPGEKLRSVALGDTVRWVIGQTEAGSGRGAQEVVLLKPVRSGLETNAVITTNRRTYQLELTSYRETYMASVSWSYPGTDVHRFDFDDVEELSNVEAVEEAAIDDGSVEGESRARGTELGVDVGSLNFDYGFRVDDPDRPPHWKPVRVFDDGTKTYLQFAEGVRMRELPAFFLLSRTGRPEIANYRVRGDYLIVDQVVDVGVLRMAEEDVAGETVGIERLGGK